MSDAQTKRNEIDFRHLHPSREKTVVNYGEGKTPSTTKGTRFDLSDINFTNHERRDKLNSINKGKKFNKLEINEFQTGEFFKMSNELDMLVRSLGVAGKELLNLMGTVVDGAKNATGIGSETSEKNKASTIAFTTQLSNDDQTIEAVLKHPMKIINNYFNGRFIAYYEMPYEGKEYISAKGSDGWAEAGEAGGMIGSMVGVLQNHLPIDIPKYPEWQLKTPASAEPISAEFTLFNDNLENLIKNFRYIHALCAGAFWMYIEHRTVAPNVYEVHYPGFFHYHYCKLDIAVTSGGVMRNLTDKGLIDFKKKTGATGLPTNAFFPDFYNLKATFTSIIPNNFNTYLNYLLNGPGDTVKIGESRSKGGLMERINSATDGAFGARSTTPSEPFNPEEYPSIEELEIDPYTRMSRRK